MPKYKEICNKIRLRIKNGEFKITNNQIPDELSLCREYYCSRMTMKKALDLLVLEGMIYRKRGHGSFVMNGISQDPKINVLDSELGGFTKISTGTVKTKLLDFKLIFADVTIASKLNIAENSPVYGIIRVRYIDDKPYVLEKTYMDSAIITGLNADILNNSIYEHIEENLNLKISSGNKIIRACKSNYTDIRHLELEASDPILEVEQIAYLSNGKAFEYSLSRHRYDKFEFTSFSVRH